MHEKGSTFAPALVKADAVAAVLLSSSGESDGWETEVFDALCRTHSNTHLHFVLPPPTDLFVQLCTSLSGAFGPITSEMPRYSSADDVVDGIAASLASSGRSWSWSESPAALTRAAGTRGKRLLLVGGARRPVYAVWFGLIGYRPS